MRKSRLSWYKQSKLIELFVAGSTARVAAELVNVNIKTAVYQFHRLRQLIYDDLTQNNECFDGEIELDESYFVGKRKGKRGRAAAGKTIVFGLLKRNGKVYTVIVPDFKKKTLMPVIRQKVQPDSVVNTDSMPSYNALDVFGFKHHHVNHSKEFVNELSHMNGIENFWNQAKRHLRKFNGVPQDQFHLYLKECEWRFNNSKPKDQLTYLKKLVKKSMAQLSGVDSYLISLLMFYRTTKR